MTKSIVTSYLKANPNDYDKLIKLCDFVNAEVLLDKKVHKANVYSKYYQLFECVSTWHELSREPFSFVNAPNLEFQLSFLT